MIGYLFLLIGVVSTAMGFAVLLTGFIGEPTCRTSVSLTLFDKNGKELIMANDIAGYIEIPTNARKLTLTSHCVQ